MVVEGDEKFFVVHHFALPGRGVNSLKLLERGAEFSSRRVETSPFDVFKVGSPADGGFLALGSAPDAVDDPLENTHVLRVAGPQKTARLVLAKPVDVEDARRIGERPLHLDPVPKVVAHVIAAERQHGHGVATDFADWRSCGCGRLRPHRRAGVDAGRPVESLVDKRHSGSAPGSREACGAGHAVGVLPAGIDAGTLRGGSSKTLIGMSGGGYALPRS